MRIKNELWSAIPGFSNYQVSNMGRVRSKARISKRDVHGDMFLKQKILKGATDAMGYLHVRLVPDDGSKPVLWKIHQLVGLVYYDYDRKNRGNMVIDHIDGNKKNNKVSNLQLMDGGKNLGTGCTSKAIQRRLPAQTYYIDDYVLVINKLQGDNISDFNHYLSDPTNKKIKYHFTSKIRMLYEQVIQKLLDEGVIE